jgi:hypothetical protein
MTLKTLEGTCSNVKGSMEYEARPFESDRMAVAYPNISASGTFALTIVWPALESMVFILPRRRLMSPTKSP